jgi:NADH-quinone oxidoreductase subunit M
MTPLLSVVLLAPAAGALTVLLMGSRGTSAARPIACGATATSLVASLPLWLQYASRGAEWQFTERIAWLPWLGGHYALGIDGLGLALVVVTAMTGFATVCWPWKPGSDDARRDYASMLVVQTGLLAVFMALDLLLLLVGWQVAVVGAVLLLRRSGAPPRSVKLTGTVAILAGAVMLGGILTLAFHYYSLAGIYSFDLRPLHRVALPQPLQTSLFVAFFFVFAATMGGAGYLSLQALKGRPDGADFIQVLVAAGLLKLGAYGFLRISLPIFPEASRAFGPAIMVVALVAVALAGGAALAQTNWKRVVAYVSMSHAALAIVAAFALTPNSITASILLLVAHSVSICALCLGGAFVQQAGGMVSLREGRWRELAGLVPLMGAAAWIGVHPAPLLSRIETPVARVVMRVSPEYAADVADCLKPQAPPAAQADSGLPAGMVMAAPCSDGSTPPKP